MQQEWSAGEVALMQHALALAALGPAMDPNPRVGAVLVDRAGQVVGTGYHRGTGTAHAEAEALAVAGRLGRGGTLFVTLEPCAHTGRTGPCTEAVIGAGVARVVFAQADPNPVARGGASVLRAARVAVEAGLLGQQAAELNRAWTFAVAHERPYVVWKFAATLDGRSAAADGSSRWITGEASRADVHDLRARCGAILVGTGTVLADDPWLTARHPDGSLRERQPLRVVLGERRVPAGARVRDSAAETLLLSHRDPDLALKTLADRQIRGVWLEGGPTLASAFLRCGLVDEVTAYLAPALLGSGAPAVAELGIETLAGALRLDPFDVRVVGQDVRLRATLTAGP
ncbi:MAG TPA: bifunctional diaminohydroxyphosphoribosylaminopyrimidine deaminase/5-amino-6-(5-phosphoribosylamino)uracil reductase RibD [Dermatophilaceae bacterium]|nr:bifunctional diaminohydroxyphosphoribosylaminopyrimidine deaminase/5-amino-6-(5-phosphoribosylamino)uracil reductase RibD [Dermatophilaceae bacterium]